ncbi:MAG: hypothetical protein GQ469_08285 [Methanosarcinales archaeon]|nr:hypothetical protein [Methanosarcinales archaeon]
MCGEIETFPCIQTLLVLSGFGNTVRSGYITNGVVTAAAIDITTRTAADPSSTDLPQESVGQG